MALKLIELRRDDSCAACSAPTPATTTAWWDPASRRVTCTRCRPVEFTPLATAHELAPPQPISVGVAGHSAGQEHARRLARHENRAGATAEVPHHVTAWERGAIGERELGDYLEQLVAGRAIVLHDRKVDGTRGNIDHIVIASSGIWVIDAKNYAGQLGFKSSGILRPKATELYVGSRRRTKLVEAMAWQCDAVRALIEPMGMGGVPVRSALCFLHTEWNHRNDVETIHEVIVAPPAALGRVIMQAGWVEPDAINAIATQLSAGLPASAPR